MDDKTKRLEVLRNLLALANNNPNKAEAMAAIGRFHILSEKYGLTLDEVKSATADDFRETSMYSGERQYGFVDQYLWKTLAQFCGVKVGVGTDKDGDLTLRYFGLEAEVMEAVALRATIRAAMAFEWKIHWKYGCEGQGNVKSEMEWFHRGFADECRERMEERKKEVEADVTGNALVVKKWEVVSAEADKRGFQEAVSGKGRRGSTFSQGAYGSGREAGKRVDFGTAVSGRGTKMIGK